jgi:hypothetical protein
MNLGDDFRKGRHRPRVGGMDRSISAVSPPLSNAVAYASSDMSTPANPNTPRMAA